MVLQSSPAARQPAQQQSAIAPANAGVAGAIQRAAQATGANFEYLLATAKVESNLNPNLKARGSSATGLFQFIEQTWLGMMKNAGRTLGFGGYADAISRTASGRYEVTDPRLRNEILQLRRDPAANAAMAGAFTRQNAAKLQQRIGRTPTDSELYIAHFFGSGGAGSLIAAARERPQANAAAMFPSAARANRSIFYDRSGNARSVSGVYAELSRRYQVARANVAPALAPSAVAATAAVPDTAATARAFEAAAPRPVVASAEPVFRSLFQSGEGRGPVSPVVTELWSTPSSSPAAAPQAPDAATAAPLDLFRELRPSVRGLFTGQS